MISDICAQASQLKLCLFFQFTQYLPSFPSCFIPSHSLTFSSIYCPSFPRISRPQPSSICASRPTTVLDRSCLSCLRSACSHAPKCTVDLSHTGSSSSLFCIIVQLTSQSETIMWESLRIAQKNTLRESGWWGGKGMFSSDVHVHIVSSPLMEGLFIWEDRGGVVQPLSHESTDSLILWPVAPPGQLWSSKVISEACFMGKMCQFDICLWEVGHSRKSFVILTILFFCYNKFWVRSWTFCFHCSVTGL